MLKPKPLGEIPEATARIVKAAFPKGNIIMRLRDNFDGLFKDEDFSDLYPDLGQPALSPWRLALVTLMQFMENLTDRQAANAVRLRLDWKYALGLELEDTGFDYSVLSEFRDRLIEADAQERLLDTMLEHFKVRGLVKDKGKQRTDSTQVLANIRVMNRLEKVIETMRAALNEVATVAPEWLQELADDSWYERYAHRVEDYRLAKSKTARDDYAKKVGEDGYQLLDAIKSATLETELNSLVKVEVLRKVWERHYERKGKRVRWRDKGELSKAAQSIESPYDPDARFSTKRGKDWVGYKVHFSEICDEDAPNVIVNVLTTAATEQDVSCTESIHVALKEKGLNPEKHYVDAGYTDAELLAASPMNHAIKLIGPTRVNPNWQTKIEGGISLYDFDIDWENKVVTCPANKQSSYWRAHQTKGDYPHEAIQVRFSNKDCKTCDFKSLCTRSERQGRYLKFQPQARFEALKQARAFMASEAGKQEYRIRAGVEGTMNQAANAFGGRRARYKGQDKTHFQQLMIGSAINIVRVDNFLNEKPKGKTPISRFAKLKQAA
jgi:transposase